jgi:hypothetical protein
MVLTATIMNSSIFLAATTCNPKLTNISGEHTPKFYLLPVSFWIFYLAESLLFNFFLKLHPLHLLIFALEDGRDKLLRNIS